MLRAYYAGRARYYDAVYEKPERQDDLVFLKKWIPPVFAGRHVLEVACGTGYWTQYLAPTVASIVATDIVPEPLRIAKRRVRRVRARFLCADAYALPAQLGTFDAAFAGLWISHVPRLRVPDFLRSLHRRLKPGAVVLLIDNSEAQCRDLPISDRDTDGNTYQHRVLHDGTVHRVLKNFPSQTELESMIDGFGTNPKYLLREHFWTFRYEAAHV